MHFANSGEEALEKLAEGIEPTLIVILSDINMPGMDGLTLLREIKARRPDLPVMMVTAYGDEERQRPGRGVRRNRVHHQAGGFRSPQGAVAAVAQRGGLSVATSTGGRFLAFRVALSHVGHRPTPAVTAWPVSGGSMPGTGHSVRLALAVSPLLAEGCPRVARAEGERMTLPRSSRGRGRAGLPSNLPIDGHSFRRVEVLTGVPRRRRWSAAEKAAIVAESLIPGAGGEYDRVAPRAAPQPALCGAGSCDPARSARPALRVWILCRSQRKAVPFRGPRSTSRLVAPCCAPMRASIPRFSAYSTDYSDAERNRGLQRQIAHTLARARGPIKLGLPRYPRAPPMLLLKLRTPVLFSGPRIAPRTCQGRASTRRALCVFFGIIRKILARLHCGRHPGRAGLSNSRRSTERMIALDSHDPSLTANGGRPVPPSRRHRCCRQISSNLPAHGKAAGGALENSDRQRIGIRDRSAGRRAGHERGCGTPTGTIW